MKTPLHRQIAIGALVVTAATMPFSVRLCHWSFLLFVLFWVVEGHWQTKWSSIKSNPLSWLMPVYFLVHVLGMFYTTSADSGLLQLEKKAAFVLVPLTLVSTPTLSRTELGVVMKVFILACTVAALYCVAHAWWVVTNGLPIHNLGEASTAEFLRLNPGISQVWMGFSYISLASGIGAHPTYLGLYLVLCLLLILFFFKKDEVSHYERVAGRVIFCFFLTFIFFLSSRIITLATIFVTMAAVAIKLPRKSEGWAFATQVAIGIAFLLVVYTNPVSRYRGLQEPAAASFARLPDYAVTSIEIRLSLLKLSTMAGKDVSPWFGSGTGSAEDRLREAGSQYGISNSLDSYDPHNQFIYAFFELGLVGLLVFAGLMFITLRAAWQKRSQTLAGLVMVFFAVCLTESALELQKGIVLFVFFGSLLLFHERAHQARGDHHV